MADKKGAAKPKAQKGIWQKYKVSGDKLEKTNTSCPKCGSGHFMGVHKNRTVCGGCGYTEFKTTEKK